MSPSVTPTCASGKRFPRVSGDEPDAKITNVREATFSPRERG